MRSDCAINRTGRVKSSLKPLTIGFAALALALAALYMSDVQASQAGASAQAGERPTDATGPRMGPKVRPPETEVIRLRAGQLPYVTLTSDIFYRILASEIAAQRGVFGSAGTTMVGLARDTGDARLARRGLEFFLAGGNVKGALDAARVWARLAPTDLEAGSTELALAAANGQTKGLAQALRTRIDASPDKPAALAQALAVLSRLSDRRMALQILDDALSDDVRRLPEARMALADVAQAAGDAPRALTEARMAQLAAPASEDAAQRVLEYGMAIDPARALADARAFLAKYPQARKLHLMLASQLAESGDVNGALAELQAMSRQAPEDFDLMLLQAQLQYRAGRSAEARKLLEQYVEVQDQRQRASAPGATDAGPAAAEAHILLARIAEDEGRYDDAVAQLDRIDDPSLQYSSQLRQAGLRAQQGRVDEALALIDNAGPQDEEERLTGVLAKAQILREAGRIDEAVALLEQADRDIPDVVEIKYELGMLYERQGRLKDLERELRQVIALDPQHAHAYNALGYTLADNKLRLSEAHDLIAHALTLLPNDPFILDSMGWVKYRLGDLPAAVDYLRRAYAIRPEPDIAAHLGEVLWIKGDRDEAQKLLRKVLAESPDNPTLKQVVDRLGVRL